VLQSGAVKYLLIVCAVVGAVTLYLLPTRPPIPLDSRSIIRCCSR
jgi:hypothetical protein